MLKRCARALAALGLCGMTGCFVYVPAEVQSVPAGERVQVRVSRSAVDQLAEVLPVDEPVLRGTLVRSERDRLFVRVPIATRREGLASRTIDQEVSIARGDVLEVARRRRSGTRTALFVGGTAVVAGAVIATILGDARDKVIRDDLPPDEIRIPPGR